MCKSCWKWKKELVNGRIIVERIACNCVDCFPEGYNQCPKCKCRLDIVVVGMNDGAPFEDVWIDERTKHPVPLDGLVGKGQNDEFEIKRKIEELRRRRGYIK
jgi:hypothetical protein